MWEITCLQLNLTWSKNEGKIDVCFILLEENNKQLPSVVNYASACDQSILFRQVRTEHRITPCARLRTDGLSCSMETI